VPVEVSLPFLVELIVERVGLALAGVTLVAALAFVTTTTLLVVRTDLTTLVLITLPFLPPAAFLAVVIFLKQGPFCSFY